MEDAIKACTHGIIIISQGFSKATPLEDTVASALVAKALNRSNSSPFSLFPVCVGISGKEMRDIKPLLADLKPLEVDQKIGLERGVRSVMAELAPLLSSKEMQKNMQIFKLSV